MQLTQEQAYLAMYYFLKKQFSLGWEELGGLLSSMSLLSDGEPADLALASEWQEAITASLSGTIRAQLELRQ